MGTLVVVRIRPFNGAQKDSCLASSQKQNSIACAGNEFRFDHIFGEETNQHEVFEVFMYSCGIDGVYLVPWVVLISIFGDLTAQTCFENRKLNIFCTRY